MGPLPWFFVDPAVQLHNEPSVVAVEDRDVLANRHLAAEFESEELPAP